jgi:hypothetical protein
MTIGCQITKNGDPTTEEYLDWFDDYQLILLQMKSLETKLNKYRLGVDNPEHRRLLDRHRKELIRIRKRFGKAHEILSDV